MPHAKPKIIGREDELQLLQAFVTGQSLTTTPNLIVLGYKAVGKSYTVLQHLDQLQINRTIINCDECLTHKLLLQKCLNEIKNDSGVDLANYKQKYMYKGLEAARVSLLCENFAYFLMALEQFCSETDYDEPHVLVLDRFDECCDPTDELFASFLKLHEQSSIKNLSIIYIISHDVPREILTFATPRLHMNAYLREELTAILQEKQLYNLPEQSADVNKMFWNNFAKLMVDLFFDYTGSHVSLIINLCEKLWPKFADPVKEGRYQPQDILRIYRDIKSLLFNDHTITSSTVEQFNAQDTSISDASAASDLPYHSKFLLIAAYLASYVDQKYDLQFFSRIKLIKKRQKPSASNSITKSSIDSRLLSASFFDLERLKAIFSVIYRNESRSLNQDSLEFINLYLDMDERELARKEKEFATFTLNPSVDINTQLSTLVSLGLITRTYALDILSSKIRWKCTTSWEVIAEISREILFPILNYLVDK